MTVPERTAAQLDLAMNGPAWHGPALLELLSGITADEAAWKPSGGVHTIWEIVLHLGAWHWVVVDRLHGQSIADLPEEVGWPQARAATSEAWEEALAQLKESHQALRDVIRSFPTERYDEAVPGQSYSFYVMLQGIIQHDLYHAGQIAILIKQARAATS